MKKTIKLTEEDLHKMIKRYVKQSITESYSDKDAYQKWNAIKEALGSDTMVDNILQYLDSRIIDELIDNFNQDYEIFEDDYAD